MAGHVPPPGAEEEIDLAAGAYLVAVQKATGTTHKLGNAVIAIGGLLRVAQRFGLGAADILAAVLKMLA